MKTKTVNVIRDFNPKPYGRYPREGKGCGENFRKVLEKELADGEQVHVDLTGYNRYGRSFLDEAFGGLIRESGYTLEELNSRLSYSHDLVKSIEDVIAERLEAAEKDRAQGK